MGFIEVDDLSYKLPGGRVLFDEVTFKVHAGQHAALVGANGVGKTTLLRILAREETQQRGSFRIDGRVLYMPQLIGSIADQTTVRDLLLSLSSARVQQAAAALARAEETMESDGVRYANALAVWGDAGGYEAEVAWDVCTTQAFRQPMDVAGSR